MLDYNPPGAHFTQTRGFLALIFQALQGHSPVKVIDVTCQLLTLLLTHCSWRAALPVQGNWTQKAKSALVWCFKLQWDNKEALAYTAQLRGENSPECSSTAVTSLGVEQRLLSRDKMEGASTRNGVLTDFVTQIYVHWNIFRNVPFQAAPMYSLSKQKCQSSKKWSPEANPKQGSIIQTKYCQDI